MIDKVLHTLVELCVGNYYNQQVIYERQIVDAVNAIFKCKISERTTPDGTVVLFDKVGLWWGGL